LRTKRAEDLWYAVRLREGGSLQITGLEQQVAELHTDLEQRLAEREAELEAARNSTRLLAEAVATKTSLEQRLAEREAELEATRDNTRLLTEAVAMKDEALRQMAAELEVAAARAAQERGRLGRAPLDHHVWCLGTKQAAQGVAAQEAGAPPPPASGQAMLGPEDGLAHWLTHGGTDMVCSVVATALCKLVEAIAAHPPALRSNGFFEDSVVAATAKAAKAAAGRESQQREHPAGSPLDVIKAALDGAATYIAAPHSTTGAADSTAEAPDADESDAQMEQLFQIVQSTFDANHDEVMDAEEMKLYLVAVGAWGSEPVYTDEKWPRAWPGICSLMEVDGAQGKMVDGAQGLPLSSFKMYHEKYRRGKLAHDLNQLSFGISNPAAREWWQTHIGLRRSVRVQLAADAFAVWLEGQGLPAMEAQILIDAEISGGLAAHGIGADAHGDVTVGEFNKFTAGMEEFTIAAVRGREVMRADVDTGSAEDFARHLGIDAGAEPELMWIAEQCRVAPLPANWAEHFTAEGDSYFHNARRGSTVWHHPLDLFFKQLAQARRADGKA
jgi:hypothetical protein